MLLALFLIIVGTVIIGAAFFAFNAQPLGAGIALFLGFACWIIAWRVDRKPKVVLPEGEMPLSREDAPLEVRRKQGKIIALAFFFGFLAFILALPVVSEALGMGPRSWPLAIIAGAAVGGLYAWAMLRHNPFIRVDAMGFTAAGQRALAWREIEGVRLFEITVKGQSHNHLHLRLAKPEQHFDRVSGLRAWTLKRQGVLHYSLNLVDTDMLVIFEAISRRVIAANAEPVLTVFSAKSKWEPWVRAHIKFGHQDNAPAWQERVNKLYMAMIGGWAQYDDAEASAIKLKLKRAEHKQLENDFVRLDKQVEEAVARQASEAEIQALFTALTPDYRSETPEVAALKSQLKIKARKVQRNNFITYGVVGVLLILYVWFRVIR